MNQIGLFSEKTLSKVYLYSFILYVFLFLFSGRAIDCSKIVA